MCGGIMVADHAACTCRLAKARHIRVIEAHVFPLLRLCFNCMRAMWRPGGYPPTADAHALVPGTRCG